MIIEGEKYLNEKELASYCGQSLTWVRGQRYKGKKFPYYKLNGRVLFNQLEIDNWFKDNLKAMC